MKDITRKRIVPCRRSYLSPMKDKGKYFSVNPETFHKCIEEATMNERKLYAINSNELALFYTPITALEEKGSQWFDV